MPQVDRVLNVQCHSRWNQMDAALGAVAAIAHEDCPCIAWNTCTDTAKSGLRNNARAM